MITVGELPSDLISPADIEPYLYNDDKLYVANHDSNTASIINTTFDKVVKTIFIGDSPTTLKFWKDALYFWRIYR